MSKIIEYGVNFIDNITISSLVVTSISASSLSISGAATLPANMQTTNLSTSNLISTNVYATLVSTANLVSTIATIPNLRVTNISTGDLRSTNAYATLVSTANLVSTNISTTTLITSTRGILIGTNTYDDSIFINALDPGMPAGDKWLTFGQAASNNNRAEINFNWITTGNVSNSMSLGLYGTRVMTLNGAGNVGIGITNPSNTLHVNGTLRVSGLITTTNLVATNISSGVVISNTTSKTDGSVILTNIIGGGVIQFEDIHHSIWGRRGGDGIFNRMQFREFGNFEFWNGGLFEAQTPKMIINDTGNVGIGTTSPTAKLDVYSNDTSNEPVRLLDLKRNLSDGAKAGSFMGKNTGGSNGLWSWYHHISDGNASNYVHYDWNGYVNAVIFNAQGRVGLSTTAPTNTLHVNGDLRVSSFITTSNLICTNLTTNSLSIPVISDVPAIDPNMTNTLIVHEDFRGTTLRSGTTSGSVSYVQNTGSNNGYLQLTPNSNSQNGYLSWKINPGNAFTITFDHYAGGGLGDMISFSWSSDNISSFGTGYLVEFNELGNIIILRFNGAVLASSATITNLGNLTWHKSTITFYRNQIRVIYDGVVVINYTDTVFRNVNGAYMYFYSFTGSVSNFHRIRNFRMSKVTEGLWQYQESTSGNIVYNGGNVGIGTAAPSNTLHVNGDLRVSSFITTGSLFATNIASGVISSNTTSNTDCSLLLTNNVEGGVIQFDDEHHAIWGKRGSNGVLDVMQLREFGQIQFWNGGFLNNQIMRMVIRADGNVGIGTATPSYKLDVAGNARFTNSIAASNIVITTTDNQTLMLADLGTTGAWAIGANNGAMQYQVGNGSTGAHIFYTSSTTGTANAAMGTERMRINGLGNVGIGTNNPSYNLDVNGTVRLSTTRGLLIGTSTDIDGGRLISALDSNMPANSTKYLSWGRNNTNNNQAELSFTYVGDGSGLNSMGLGFFGGEKMRIQANGFVGIGLGDPKYPLQVQGNTTATLSGGYAYLNRSNPTGISGPSEGSYSIYCNARIAASEFNAFSDSRIKENIQDIDDLSALSSLRLIQPKKYNYIDKITRGETPVWGFIAQQVGSVLDHSTGRIIDYIPSVYDIADVTNSENVVTLKLKIKTTSGLVSTSTGPVKIKLFTDEKNTECIATLKDIIDENTFTINESLNQTSQVFVYGIEVSDFHTLNKDAIFTVNVAATQELDREVQIVNQKYSDLEQKYNDLDQKYNDILTMLQK